MSLTMVDGPWMYVVLGAIVLLCVAAAIGVVTSDELSKKPRSRPRKHPAS